MAKQRRKVSQHNKYPNAELLSIAQDIELIHCAAQNASQIHV